MVLETSVPSMQVTGHGSVEGKMPTLGGPTFVTAANCDELQAFNAHELRIVAMRDGLPELFAAPETLYAEGCIECLVDEVID